MRIFEINEKIATSQSLFNRANNVFCNTESEYENKILGLKKNSDNRVNEYCNSAKKKIENERRELSQKLKKISEILRKISEGIKKWRASLPCVLKVNIQQDSKKTVKATKAFLALLNNAETVKIDELSKVFDNLYNKLYSIEKKALLRFKKQHIFRMMLLCEQYALEAKADEEKVLNRNAQDIISGIEDDRDLVCKEIEEKESESCSKYEKNLSDDIDFITNSTIMSFAELFKDQSISESLRIKTNYLNLKHDNTLTVFNSPTFPQEIYLGDMTYPFSKLNSGQFKNKAIGQLSKDICNDELLTLPLTHRFDDCKSYLFVSKDEEAYSAEVIKQFLYYFCRQLSPGEAEFVILDPIKKGLSVKQFLDLKDKLPEAFGGKIYTSTQDIKDCLNAISIYIDNVIQHNLANRFENAAAYNEKVAENRLPIKILCLFNLSKIISSGSDIGIIIDILENAHKCGICVLIDMDYDCLNSRNFSDTQIKKLKEYCEVFQLNAEFPVSYSGAILLQDELPNNEKMGKFFTDYSATAKSIRSKGMGFAGIMPDNLFGMSSANGLSIPVGKGADSQITSLEFGKVGSSHHALITGGTGSGKSTLLHTIILSATLNYSPDELNLYLMDFKSGTEFKVYENHRIPHIKLLALDAMQEFGESILEEINHEMDRRAVLFKQAGVSDLPSYISVSGKKLPRILIIMDEFQILFSTSHNRKVANECAKLTNAIVKLGRSYGVHLVMSTQSLAVLSEDSSLDSSTIEQMRIRIGLKFDEREAKRLFGDNGSDAMIKMRGAIGTAVYNKDFTECDNNLFRTAYCDDKMKNELLEKISHNAKNFESTTMQVFEGGRIPDYPSTCVERKSNEVNLLIGEPIKVANPLNIILSRKKPSNIAVVGTDNELMARITKLLLLELFANKLVYLYYADGNEFIDEADENVNELLDSNCQKIERLNTRAKIVESIDKLYIEYNQCREEDRTATKTHILFINHAQNIDLVKLLLKGERVNRENYIKTKKENNGESKSENESPAKEVDFRAEFKSMLQTLQNFNSSQSTEVNVPLTACFKELVDNGYSYGIYIVLLFDDPAIAIESLGHASVVSGNSSKFPNKIAFRIGEDLCGKIISDLNCMPTNEIVAVYSNGVTQSIQFKPYNIQ